MTGASLVFTIFPTGRPSPEQELFSLSLHTTPLSAPFLALAPARPAEDRVRWGDLDHEERAMGGARAVVVRLWRHQEESEAVAGGSSTCLAVWGVGLAGLVCVGDQLPRSFTSLLLPDSLVFRLHTYYFVAPGSLRGSPPPLLRHSEVPHITVESGKPSYSRSSLAKLHSTLRALRQSSRANALVKSELGARGLDCSGAELAPAPQLGRSISSRVLEVRVKTAATRRREQVLDRRLEDLRFSIDSARLEKERLEQEVAERRSRLEREGARLESVTSGLMENYHSLARDREKLESWLGSFQRSRESRRKAGEALRLRRLQLVSQLSEIFTIREAASDLPTICHVALPPSDKLQVGTTAFLQS